MVTTKFVGGGGGNPYAVLRPKIRTAKIIKTG
jgi:hypothetical protein